MKTAIWTAMYAELSLANALNTLSGQGWKAFEISTEHLVQLDTTSSSDIKEALNLAADRQLTISQAHGYLQADIAAEDSKRREEDVSTLERHLSICADLGVGVMVVHPGGRIANPTAAEKERIADLNIEALRRLGKHASALGIRIGLENLTHPGASTAADLLSLIEAIADDTYGVTLDTSHANLTALDIPSTIRELGPALIATHISDNDGSGDQHRTPGTGDIDWPPVLAALTDIGYAGLFNLEIPGERHRELPLRDLKSRYALDVAKWLTARENDR